MNRKQSYAVCLIVVATCSTFCSQPLGAQVVTFSHRSSQPGDRSRQSVVCDLNAERTIRQHRQVVDSTKQQLHKNQVRSITILETARGTAARARVAYSEASMQVKAGQKRIAEAKQPIAGKVYIVTRRGEELLFTTEDGQPIGAEEEKLLRNQLSTFGISNPLARFLHGKRITVGDSLDVPNEVAAELLGLTGNQGKTEQLSLKLVSIRRVHEIPCAVFETLLKSHSDERALTLLMKGELVIDPTTCRTHAIRLNGPVAISERRGPSVGRFIVSTNGTLQVSVTNQHLLSTHTAQRPRTRR